MLEALRRLKDLQAARPERHKAQRDDEFRLRKAAKMKGLLHDAARIGFVYASVETGPATNVSLPPHAPQ